MMPLLHSCSVQLGRKTGVDLLSLCANATPILAASPKVHAAAVVLFFSSARLCDLQWRLAGSIGTWLSCATSNALVSPSLCLSMRLG
jgi:hypothetical protein